MLKKKQKVDSSTFTIANLLFMPELLYMREKLAIRKLDLTIFVHS